MINHRTARIQNLGEKVLRAIPEAVLHPSQVLHASKGAHWATLNMLDQRWLREFGVDTVLDVGANTGQFASATRIVFPAAQIYSFEPLPHCFATLERKFSGDSEFRAFNFAIGGRNREETLNLSSFSEASSLLTMANEHKEAFPWTGGESQLTVSVRTLDSCLNELSLGSKVLLKIDVQGYEAEVLNGAPEVLSRCSIVLTEVSFSQLYEGGARFNEVHALMTRAGFAFSGMLDQLTHPRTGKVLQGDSIYIRDGRI